MFYAGIGSRETPKDICSLMFKLATSLAGKSYVLRSGGALGADLAFERGCDSVRGKKEVFNAMNVSPEALHIASTIHPCWATLRDYARRLHGRNCYQVLGRDLASPSDFVICWTKGGQDVGGTRTAIILARRHNIPVYNLARNSDVEALKKVFQSWK
jgi:hypothetical protein